MTTCSTWPTRQTMKQWHVYALLRSTDDETAVLEDYDIAPQIWPEIDEADWKEIQQFVDEKAFKPIHPLPLTQDTVKIDAKWVRKWKRYPDKPVKMKSRLCARGCLDQRKTQLTAPSTTATRLSQRLAGVTSSQEERQDD